jgi:uncharacterized repeat protein (TIGR03837 family)
MHVNSIDIFCHCIDNFGDAGVAYRFARELKIARPTCRVRVFIDDIRTLSAIAGEIDTSKDIQEHGSILYINTLSLPLNGASADTLGVSDVMVEMFACHIPEPLLEIAYNHSKLIINLEYLSAEDWVEGYHLKESLLGRGTARKFFFMPGFRETTGGLIINSLLEKTRDGKDGLDKITAINDILNQSGITINPNGGGGGNGAMVGTVFTYERGFDNLISDIAGFGRETVLLVFGDKSRRGMASTLERLGAGQHQSYKTIRLIYMPFISQHGYDALLRRADFNIVRGEDSLARAALSGRPFIWNAYIQDGKYQRVKVEALLKTMRPFYGDDAEIFAAYRELMLDFNDAPSESPRQITQERYDIFLKNLKKHGHAAAAMYYFMVQNCNLIEKFCDFLDGYQP